MPPLVDPYGARPYDHAPSPTDGPATEDRMGLLWLHIRTALHRADVTRALADGADPHASRELSLRARQLTGRRHRTALARSLQRTLAEARQPMMVRAPVVIINRTAVLAAEQAIAVTVARLRSQIPVRAQGMALLERLLTNADHSPLYNPSAPGVLLRMIRVAAVALDAETDSHEFVLTA